MTATFSHDLEVFSASNFKNNITSTPGQNVYLTFGRTLVWSDEDHPDVANTSNRYLISHWKNMIGAKKVTGSDVKHGLKRIDWTANTVYNAYDDLTCTRTLMDPNNKSYVITSDNHIYKCIANNYGANSTAQPNSTSTITDSSTADGYVWKYMYTLSAEELLRFTTSEYFPVKKLISDDGSQQWNVQENAIEGAIHNILVTNPGNYTANDVYISITGDGESANAFAVINTSSNTISTIIVDNMGFGYSYANVAINSPTGSNGTARSIMSPFGGHGSDPLYELGGKYLIFNIQLENSESDKLSIQTDFREIAFIANPLKYETSNVSSNTVVSQLTKLTLSGVTSEYTLKEWVYQGASVSDFTFRGVVVDWDSSNSIIQLSNIEGIPTTELLIGSTSVATGYVSSITYPELEPFTGNFLYIDTVEAVTRANNQTESFSIVLKF